VLFFLWQQFSSCTLEVILARVLVLEGWKAEGCRVVRIVESAAQRAGSQVWPNFLCASCLLKKPDPS